MPQNDKSTSNLGPLRGSGYRLVYQVDDNQVVVIVVAVGKRENLSVYKTAGRRVKD
ncbi:type II toxin-antitoxin system RelE/ParE family toxin [Thiomonas sp.]|uniref:type II toxin-antitoxin system RelE/ParE family toxin n=1 Tax=Thiomonas sp. TaxID=2047785 RepID=UPI0039B8E939